MLTIEEVKRLQRKGYGDGKIAEELGHTKKQVQRFRHSNNIPTSKECKKKIKQKQIALIKKHTKKCNTRIEIADKINISKSEVSRLIANNNIEFTTNYSKPLRIRKFGCWKIRKRITNDLYSCECECGNTKTFTKQQIMRNVNRCEVCGFALSKREREKKFLSDYKRAEKKKHKDLKKIGKNYIIDSVDKVDNLGVNKYVDLLCTKGHMTKNCFSRYEGCKICRHQG